LVVLKIFAPWCRACKGLEPKFNAIVKDKKYADIPIIWADLTIQNNKEYVKSIGVVALPSIQFYAHGLKEDTFPCGPSKVPILKKKLSEFVNRNVDANTLRLRDEDSTPVKATSAEEQSSTDIEKEQTATYFVERERSNLRSIPYFSNMLESEFEGILSKSSLLTFDTGSIIMREGNVGRTFYVIVEGEVEICQKTSFEDPLTTPPTYLGTVINRFVKGEYFGERALITGEPRAASIRTSSLTKCLVFDKEDFPSSCALSGQTSAENKSQLQIIDEKYGVALNQIISMNDRQYFEAQKANQARGSLNSPTPIDGVDNDTEAIPQLGVEADFIVPLLIRFKLIRLVTRCFDYMVSNSPRLGDEGARRRRNMLVKLLSSSQQNDFNDAYNLIDADGDGEITLIELRRLMDSIGEEKSDADLRTYIEKGNQNLDGKQVITYEDFMGIMAEAEFYNLFYETFQALDKDDSGYLRASDLNRVLCGIRDLITDDHKSIIDVEDDDMSIDYEQFSKMLLGTALK
jgi:Ca2+-binding EF-hand superfamily protein/thiol-disulfide isomerase/thioredoxin